MMTKKKQVLTNEDGFTLIEIIAVLVILGILAAVAVPKFFDLQSKAREKAIASAVSEMRVRVNQHFARELLNGKTYGGITFNSADVDTDLGQDFFIDNWAWAAGNTNVSFRIKYPGNETDSSKFIQQTVSIKLPIQ